MLSSTPPGEVVKAREHEATVRMSLKSAPRPEEWKSHTCHRHRPSSETIPAVTVPASLLAGSPSGSSSFARSTSMERVSHVTRVDPCDTPPLVISRCLFLEAAPRDKAGSRKMHCDRKSLTCHKGRPAVTRLSRATSPPFFLARGTGATRKSRVCGGGWEESHLSQGSICVTEEPRGLVWRTKERRAGVASSCEEMRNHGQPDSAQRKDQAAAQLTNGAADESRFTMSKPSGIADGGDRHMPQALRVQR